MTSASGRKVAWLTYAWKDNLGPKKEDVDFYAQELEKQGIEIQRDRTDLIVGQRLWDQIADKIVNRDVTDAWIYVVSPHSLASQPCREELAYALSRALKARDGETFPIVGLVLGPVSGMPPAVETRLYVSIDTPDWAASVASGVRGEKPTLSTAAIEPYAWTIHPHPTDSGLTILEMRPRAGVWTPCVIGVLESEREKVVGFWAGPSGRVDSSTMTTFSTYSTKNYFWSRIDQPPVSSHVSAFVSLRTGGSPVRVLFGPAPAAGTTIFDGYYRVVG